MRATPMLEIESWPLERLILFARNARAHSLELTGFKELELEQLSARAGQGV